MIELLIVVAIILIIAAIAIPNFMGAKTSANESSSVGSLRTLNMACVTYSSTYSAGFPAALTNLGPSPTPDPTAADLIDSTLASGTKSGYDFVYVAGPADPNGMISTYTINANPSLPGQTGTRYFYTDDSGMITYAYGNPALNTDSAL
jgi:type II secretory pathway pseudopilin PulG